MNHRFILLCVVLLALATSIISAVEVTQNDLSPYHTSDELAKEFIRLEETCSIMKVANISQFGKTLQVITVAGGPQKVTFLFGEHSRELISPEVALRMVKFLCGKSETSSPAAIVRAQRALNKYTFQIFPNVNPEGRAIVESGRYCHRTNANNVDLNRNYDVAWRPGGNKQTAAGPSAFSEAEVRIVKSLLESFKPDVFFSVHSGALGMYTPYAYKKTDEVVLSAAHPHIQQFLSSGKDIMMDVLQSVNQNYCRCLIGPAARNLGYTCPGNCMDYVFDKLHVPFSFAFEVWDGRSYANAKSAALVDVAGETQQEVEEESELDLDALFEVHHEHDHDHEHEHEFEEEDEEIIALELGSRVKRTHRGHSCFSSYDDFAPTKEMEGLVALQLEETVTVTGSAKPFPVPANAQLASCFRQFNPPGKTMYERTVDHWSSAFLTILSRLPDAQKLRMKFL